MPSVPRNHPNPNLTSSNGHEQRNNYTNKTIKKAIRKPKNNKRYNPNPNPTVTHINSNNKPNTIYSNRVEKIKEDLNNVLNLVNVIQKHQQYVSLTQQITFPPYQPNNNFSLPDSYFSFDDNGDGGRVMYRSLDPSEPEYCSVRSLITNRLLVVDKIEKIRNPYLRNVYEDRKRLKQTEFEQLEEKWLFHGTKMENVESICTHNFDWRLAGSNRGHKFGWGVSFATTATYASHYTDKNVPEKVIILASVLVGNSCLGNENMEYPPPGFDTTHNETEAVFVKYDEADYYPAYNIYFHFQKYFQPNPYYFSSRRL